jgi:hypothetical protein
VPVGVNAQDLADFIDGEIGLSIREDEGRNFII